MILIFYDRKTGISLKGQIERDEDELDNVDSYWKAAAFPSPIVIDPGKS
jgi:hypothetical protein